MTGGAGASPPAKVIFACVHSAGRSQMAAAWFRAVASPARATALAAGTDPAADLHAEVRTVLEEAGLDLTDARPRLLTPELAAEAALLVTMGCGETCPHVPGLETVDWALDDPKGRSLDAVRALRDEIRERVTALVRERGW